MEKLIQRVRGVMHLLLVWALVLLWVATIEPVDIHRNCLDLEISWNHLVAAAQHGGKILPASLASIDGPPLNTDEAVLLQEFNDQCSELCRCRNSSLSSPSTIHYQPSAEEYIEACSTALAIAEEAAAANHPGLSSRETAALIASIERQIRLLSWHVERLDLGPAATLRDVANEARPRISIPGSGLTIPMAGGVAWSIVGLSCVYLYLVSLLRALREAMDDRNHSEAGDWLLLHPGLLGPSLGVVWLTMPLVALFSAGSTVFAVQAVNTVSEVAKYFAFLLPASWLWCVVAAFRIRRKVSKLSCSVHAASSSAAAANGTARDLAAWVSESDTQARKSVEQRLEAHTDTGLSLETYRRAA